MRLMRDSVFATFACVVGIGEPTAAQRDEKTDDAAE